nr:dTDP-4-dehydrorhamnose reductase [Chromatocurvus halotolerans]
MRVLVTGAHGQLGRELGFSVPQGVECVALERDALDITDAASIADALSRVRPAALINAAAYTAVDRAETDREAAHAVNDVAVGLLATACRERDIRMLHVSTDFVFDGASGRPYQPTDTTGPLGVYGASKLAGETRLRSGDAGGLVLRTGWVYSRHGGNFVLTMLRLMADKSELGVVADQVGTPTWARGLATTLWAFAENPDLCGIYHWSDAGVCSWYDFAVAIAEEACALGLLQRAPYILPIATTDYPTAARRPACSVLDKRDTWRDLSLQPLHWRAQLRRMLQDLKNRNPEDSSHDRH